MADGLQVPALSFSPLVRMHLSILIYTFINNCLTIQQENRKGFHNSTCPNPIPALMLHGHIASSRARWELWCSALSSPLWVTTLPFRCFLCHYPAENHLSLLRATAVEGSLALQQEDRSTALMLWEGDSATHCYHLEFTYTTASASL